MTYNASGIGHLFLLMREPLGLEKMWESDIHKSIAFYFAAFLGTSYSFQNVKNFKRVFLAGLWKSEGIKNAYKEFFLTNNFWKHKKSIRTRNNPPPKKKIGEYRNAFVYKTCRWKSKYKKI